MSTIATITVKSINDIQMNKRRDWGTFSPVTRVVRDKTKYTRKDKSWKKDLY